MMAISALRTQLHTILANPVKQALTSDFILSLYAYQYTHNELYRGFATAINKTPTTVKTVKDIPYLPISFFKTHTILTNTDVVPSTLFTSSSTTSAIPSTHYVADIALYEATFLQNFTSFYGDVKAYTILALLPNYLERKGSSLVYMVQKMMDIANNKYQGFFLNNTDDLYVQLGIARDLELPTILIGVSFALLDFVERYQLQFPELIVMETGGMKGRRKEIIREELHQKLKDGFGVSTIHAEYGMTELLSQAYSKGNGIFYPPSTMQVVAANVYNPLQLVDNGITGTLNVIDVSNIDSCAFLATEDIGRVYADGSFEVLGRKDNSVVRGCNLMVGSM